MESNQEVSGYSSRAKGKKTDKGRRVWTDKEEETLLAGMKEVLAHGWKLDNGFKAGYLNKLEAYFNKHLPGTDIKGSPQINSKLTAWKRVYYPLADLLSCSGVGFNHETHTVECEKEQWAEIIKVNPGASKFKGNSWPLYDQWVEMFGKDRAKGYGALHLLSAVNDLEREYAEIDKDYAPGDYEVKLDDIFSTDKGENSVCQSHLPDKVPKYKVKKRKSSEGMETVCDLLREISTTTNSRLETLASRIGYDHDVGKARSEVFGKLGTITGLSIADKFKVCEILGKEVEKLQIFNGLSESARPEYVHYVLNSN